jgi:hypothetical protein
VRQDPQPGITNERETIDQYLDYQRETILLKTEGLSKEQLGQRVATSDLTLAGILFHLRWVLLHLIEETARHAGHADLLREAVDGSVGE